MGVGIIILNGILIIITALALTVITLEKIQLRTSKAITLAWYGINIIYFIGLWIIFMR